ncbi:hypothetical protein B0T25DRAFT_227127 [Lasiosphaeria hispida]|uniref:Uncharacterized protein n=1 Tax=Lasiosphaeria hispida TaxID=260671 RepID=A0AAJ0MBK9_9PEZI|nr:hypothetical protein B0T25DRAFT_227127 [Lasiosphaeria hispida]
MAPTAEVIYAFHVPVLPSLLQTLTTTSSPLPLACKEPRRTSAHHARLDLRKTCGKGAEGSAARSADGSVQGWQAGNAAEVRIFHGVLEEPSSLPVLVRAMPRAGLRRRGDYRAGGVFNPAQATEAQPSAKSGETRDDKSRNENPKIYLQRHHAIQPAPRSNQTIMPLTPEIAAILRSNPGENVLVAPSIWTCRHLELLNIEFQELQIREDSGNAEDHAKGKAGNGRRGKGVHSWPNLHQLVAHAPDSCFAMAYSQCPFRFHHRVFNLPVPLYTPRFSAPRKERKRHHSIPATLVLAGCSDIRSLNPHPFIAAALIAAAQSQAGSRRNWRYRGRHRYSVCALLDGYPDDENITIYKACISRTFLSKFGFPDTLLEYA